MSELVVRWMQRAAKREIRWADRTQVLIPDYDQHSPEGKHMMPVPVDRRAIVNVRRPIASDLSVDPNEILQALRALSGLIQEGGGPKASTQTR
jgi:hypothetical protein